MSSVNEKTKLIFVCSPNNPSGNAIPLSQIQSLLDQFSGLVVVDEAYIDFSEGGTAIHFLDEYPRLIICQTFSKAYGLAGIRLGIGFAHSTIIEFFNAIFNGDMQQAWDALGQVLSAALDVLLVFGEFLLFGFIVHKLIMNHF